jgi:recombinational DNA repair protein (RecF pathway)
MEIRHCHSCKNKSDDVAWSFVFEGYFCDHCYSDLIYKKPEERETADD